MDSVVYRVGILAGLRSKKLDGQTIGVFVAQIDVSTLNALLTDAGQWQETGQGKTGEVLMVGEDRLLRSQSRFMATDPDKFLADAQANGLPQSVTDQIRTLGTTILHMPDRNNAKSRRVPCCSSSKLLTH